MNRLLQATCPLNCAQPRIASSAETIGRTRGAKWCFQVMLFIECLFHISKRQTASWLGQFVFQIVLSIQLVLVDSLKIEIWYYIKTLSDQLTTLSKKFALLIKFITPSDLLFIWTPFASHLSPYLILKAETEFCISRTICHLLTTFKITRTVCHDEAGNEKVSVNLHSVCLQRSWLDLIIYRLISPHTLTIYHSWSG